MYKNHIATETIIVGAGFAGLSTAYHLAKKGIKSIVLEKEKLPGTHASGRNAGLLLQKAERNEVEELLTESRLFYETIASAIDFRQVGSVIATNEIEERPNISRHLYTPEKVISLYPFIDKKFLTNLTFIYTPSDGVIDSGTLLEFYRRNFLELGGKLELYKKVVEITYNNGWNVVTDKKQSFQAPLLVNAAGAWANEIASLIPIPPLKIKPFKRHLFILKGISVSNNAPFFWNFSTNYYFRDESGDLLFSMCDEELTNNLDETPSEHIENKLSEFIEKELPTLSSSLLKKSWACYRTKSPDNNFVIGWDNYQKEFFWVAALGGHGMGASFAIGKLAAEAIKTYSSPSPFTPSRLR